MGVEIQKLDRASGGEWIEAGKKSGENIINAQPPGSGKKDREHPRRRVINPVQQRRGVEKKKKQDGDKDALIRKADPVNCRRGRSGKIESGRTQATEEIHVKDEKEVRKVEWIG